VGIGGAQTGVYTRETPGGWHIIGRTPVRFFDPRRDPPSLLAPADEVRFVPVNAAELRVGESEVAAGRWSPTWEPVA
jgi:allophanate hydrolase subunit 1